MIYKKYIAIIFLLYSHFCFTQNLIQNGSFEDSIGNPSLAGWAIGDSIAPPPTGCITFCNDVPPNGDTWSVFLTSPGYPGCYMIWYLTGIQGTYVFNFTFWTKNANLGGFSGSCQHSPCVAMGRKKSSITLWMWSWNPDSLLEQPTIYNYDTIFNSWQQITLADTISSSPQDSIALIFHAGSITTPGEYDSVWVDLVKLTVTDTLTSSTNTIYIHTPDIKIYPNPFNNNTTIKFTNEKNNHIQLTLYTITGQVIRKIETSKDRISIERGELSDGMYFYQLINQNNGTILGQGKLVLQSELLK